MSKAKRGLGMGLDALLKMNVRDDFQENVSESISTDNSESQHVIAGFAEISVDKIVPNPDQPRKKFEQEALDELAQSIKNFGLIQPITVIKKGDLFEIISGERRYRASKQIGLDKIPVIIKDISQKEKLEMSLVENIQRENLNSIEEALAYSSLIETFSVTQEELGSRLGKSRTAITNSIRLLALDPQIRSWIMQDKLTPGHARAILSIKENDEHLKFASFIIHNKLTVRDAEKWSKKWPLENNKKQKQIKEKPLEIKHVETKLQEKFQTKAEINGGIEKGKIIIDYFSQEDLERIMEVIGLV